MKTLPQLKELTKGAPRQKCMLLLGTLKIIDACANFHQPDSQLAGTALQITSYRKSHISLPPTTSY